jgi:hypothetical protein
MTVDFKARQREFAAYLKNPDRHPAPPDVAENRLALYRELFFNNIDNCLSGNFPVLKTLLSEAGWHALVHDFYASHRSTTPYFAEIAEEFLDYLQHERHSDSDYPFLAELAHYEWVELALSISRVEAVSIAEFESSAGKTLRLSPLAWLLAYRFPVHRIGPELIPVIPPAQPTFLVVYRAPDYTVKFLEITPLTYRLLTLIDVQPCSMEACLHHLTAEFPQFDAQVLMTNGFQLIEDLVKKSIIAIID